ncbi:long-chain fatty acid transport protein [Thiohalospira halophila DSM 15071]|uniref:Long-chain fatty acid transport protein n=1 Tax=Thiohalospira halophila DSM 15071 TaxID=1123397 RepID=A0A1I1W4F1_9GAMM|nr:outer membrane protein transport protein [Thiohalospira halophila]SFD90126.1 long-chain fatty acid transport protein [Thiohalospira halophila DSM 15071]
MEKKMMKGTLKIGSVAAATAVALALPATASATNGYQLIGVGAYQKGMAGAVTAAPKSAMTAISNPAGMAAIGSRADFSMEAFMPERTADFTKNKMGTSPENGEAIKSEAELYGVPAIGWTAPTSEGSDLYFGGGMYGTSGLGVDYGRGNFAPGSAAGHTNVDFSGYSAITFWQMAPSLAWRASDDLKLGASLNIDYQSVGFQQRITGDTGTAPGPLNSSFLLGRTANAFGYGFTLGALYEINDMVTVGANYKSKQSFGDLEYQLRDGDISAFPDGAGNRVYSRDGTYKLGLDFPQQFAVGVKVQPMEALTVAADVKWINWSDTMDELAVKGDFRTRVGGDADGNAAMDPGWDDQTVYALAVDYAVNSDLDVRAGYNYAEAPIGEEDVFSNILLPAMTESHLTLGATYEFNNRWEASFAYMKAANNSVTGKGDIPESYQGSFGEDSQTKIDLEETSYSINLGYRF